MKTITLSVNQFNTFVKNILDAEEFLSNICVYGEVTNFKMSGGHAYFDLKDETAMLSCVKFGANDLNIKNGDLVTAFGKVNFYVKSGRLNFLVGRVSAAGMGDLYQRFLMLKQKLEKEGFFAEEIKKPIPRFAKNLGVVTSETGAVIRDIIHVTRLKNPYTNIIVYPSRVQGSGAEDDIVRGIEYFNTRKDIDTIIVARGGGSIEDLSPFNTEKIVKAIYASEKPVISAVGHETDFTLCDFAADLRVPTPSVAAEVAVFDYFEQLNNIKLINDNNYYFITKIINDRKKETANISSSIIDKTKLKIESSKNQIMMTVKDIESKIELIKKEKENKLSVLTNVISKLNPLEILKSGYAVVENQGKKLTTIKSAKVGDEITINLNDGKFDATISKIVK
ncbi:MAG: exodeoxyribonuclease VII large subunit [Clostridia bacterium]|nr:exodeoxyribonuclease VII large subunit [Clostridia bacterium]